MPERAIYDEIGLGYAHTRRADPRVAAQIQRALGAARSVVNVGAGSGSYEPRDRRVIAVEPSAIMIDQRPAGSAPVVRAFAEHLPFVDDAVDAALASLTAHHWSDPARGFAELRRVASGRVVVLHWDQSVWERYWAVTEYFPNVDADPARLLAIADVASALGGAEIFPVPVPHDCVDGFFGAYWRRPHAYLVASVRAGISAFAAMSAEQVEDGVARLAADLASGAWRDRHRDLLELDELDLGYRLIVSDA